MRIMSFCRSENTPTLKVNIKSPPFQLPFLFITRHAPLSTSYSILAIVSPNKKHSDTNVAAAESTRFQSPSLHPDIRGILDTYLNGSPVPFLLLGYHPRLSISYSILAIVSQTRNTPTPPPPLAITAITATTESTRFQSPPFIASFHPD